MTKTYTRLLLTVRIGVDLDAITTKLTIIAIVNVGHHDDPTPLGILTGRYAPTILLPLRQAHCAQALPVPSAWDPALRVHTVLAGGGGGNG